MTHSVSSMKFWTLKCNIPSGFKHKVGEITSFRCCWFQHENSTRNAGPWVSVVGFRIPIYVRRRRKLEIFNCFWNATQCVLNNKRNQFLRCCSNFSFFSKNKDFISVWKYHFVIPVSWYILFKFNFQLSKFSSNKARLSELY